MNTCMCILNYNNIFRVSFIKCVKGGRYVNLKDFEPATYLLHSVLIGKQIPRGDKTIAGEGEYPKK